MRFTTTLTALLTFAMASFTLATQTGEHFNQCVLCHAIFDTCKSKCPETSPIYWECLKNCGRQICDNDICATQCYSCDW
ncbi:hypothetical protein EJ08DRAFT_650220 [Tothia fuscella]|uniref:Uncharacterized protein n=1 Tax=Tothia fuscella TaxID=1048955 RepID=A0A9P4NQG9_9PEZI|nr:hypothetical protein EJ08DRAFT_650220 [Tothia fuscella]